jgi:hypothetical protein
MFWQALDALGQKVNKECVRALQIQLNPDTEANLTLSVYVLFLAKTATTKQKYFARSEESLVSSSEGNPWILSYQLIPWKGLCVFKRER